MLADGAGVVSTVATAAGAVKRSLLSTYSFGLANFSSEKFATSSFRESLPGCSIFLIQPQKFLAVKNPGSKVLQGPTLSVFRSPSGLNFG